MESNVSVEIKADASAEASVEIKADASATIDLPTQFNNLNQIINIFKTQLNDIQNQVKTIEKNVKKEMKNSQQTQAKEVKKSTSTPPIGFAKPAKVSDELCIFMNRPVGSEISRTDATQYLLKYIRTHGLQEMDDRKKIKLDETLSKLWGFRPPTTRGFRPPTTIEWGFRPPTTTEEDGEAGIERAEPLGFERAPPFTYYNLQTYLNHHFM
jgi:chromatin remodeling complex protein RSC6